MARLDRVFYFYIFLIVATGARGFSISDAAKKQRAADKFSPKPNLGRVYFSVTNRRAISSFSRVFFSFFFFSSSSESEFFQEMWSMSRGHQVRANHSMSSSCSHESCKQTTDMRFTAWRSWILLYHWKPFLRTKYVTIDAWTILDITSHFCLHYILFFWRTDDKSNEAPRSRSADENESSMQDILEATRSRFSSMLSQEFLMATVTNDQPEFMHNLAFQ